VAKGEVCKTFIHRFESGRRLILTLVKDTCPSGGTGRHKGLKIPWT
jgi:hypothetical protein